MVEHPRPEDVMAWADGQTGAAAAAVEQHVRGCESCRAVADDIRSVGAQLAAWSVEPATIAPPLPSPGWPVHWKWISAAALLTMGLLAWPLRHQFAPAPASEPVIVTVFVDWQCPACTHLEYAPVLAAYESATPGAVRFVVKDFPLNRRCNASVKTEAHAAACEAAAAVRMARDRGKEQELTDWIYITQSSLTPETVKAKASSLLGVTDFDAEYARRLPEITRDVSEAVVLNVRFPPSVFINGVAVNNDSGAPPSPAELDRLIHTEMTRLAQPAPGFGPMRGRVPR